MAWNEPGGEKRNPWNRPQQSQNDLDDVLRNFQRRLSALFGRGGGAAGSGGGQSSNNFGKTLSSILILIGAVWIGSGLYRVDAQERAVVLRFPDIAAKLTEFPMSYARPEQWTGFIPPKWVTAPHGSGWVLNDSPSRAALLAIHAEAVERAASGGSDG